MAQVVDPIFGFLDPAGYQIFATGLRLVEGRMKQKCNRHTDF